MSSDEDPGTCRTRLETCNKTATRVITFVDTRTDAEFTHRVCDQHARQLDFLTRLSNWVIKEERST